MLLWVCGNKNGGRIMDKKLVEELLFEIIEKICWIKNIVIYEEEEWHFGIVKNVESVNTEQ